MTLRPMLIIARLRTECFNPCNCFHAALVDTDGSVWMGDLSTGEGEVVVPATGTVANGLEYDRRSGYLYVCGGPTGEGKQGRDRLVCVGSYL